MSTVVFKSVDEWRAAVIRALEYKSSKFEFDAEYPTLWQLIQKDMLECKCRKCREKLK